MINQNILAVIGHTPLVKLTRINPNPAVTLTLKLEGSNPGGSIKDRIAWFMIDAAEKRGELHRDKTLLEPTSGNTGIGLAMVAAYKGYHLVVTMPENMSMERRRILEAMGAEVVLTPGDQGTDGAIKKAHELLAQNPSLYYMPDQFSNQDNVRAHYETTAVEIWDQTGGKVTHVVAGMGTTGTLMGISKRLKEYNPKIKVIGVEPLPGHNIQGLKNMQESKVPDIYDPSQLDAIIKVSDQDAMAALSRLIKSEGIFAGLSTGASLFGTLTLAKELDEGLIVAIAPDRGDRYVSCSLFCRECCEKRAEQCRRPPIVPLT